MEITGCDEQWRRARASARSLSSGSQGQFPIRPIASRSILNFPLFSHLHRSSLSNQGSETCHNFLLSLILPTYHDLQHEARLALQSARFYICLATAVKNPCLPLRITSRFHLQFAKNLEIPHCLASVTEMLRAVEIVSCNFSVPRQTVESDTKLKSQNQNRVSCSKFSSRSSPAKLLPFLILP